MYIAYITNDEAWLSGAIDSESNCESRGYELEAQPGHITLVATDQEINFCSYSPPSADSWRVVVNYWQKYVHLVLVNDLGCLSLPWNSAS